MPRGSPQVSPAATVVLLWPPSSGPAWKATVGGVLAEVTAQTAVWLPDSEPGRALLDAVDPAARSRLTLRTDGSSFPGALAEAAGSGPGIDVIVVADACALPPGWLQRLRHAAACDDTVVAASPLIRDIGPALFEAFDALPAPRDAARDGLLAIRPSHPRVFGLSPRCAYLRGSALELLDGADPAFSHPAVVLDDLAARALARGMSCAVADDVCAEALSGGLPARPEAERRLLSEHHPWLQAARADRAAVEVGPLRRSLVAARVALSRLTITIDARGVGPLSFGGTQAYTSALVQALAQSDRLRLRVVVGDDAAARALATEDVEIVTYRQVVEGVTRTDVVHRPQQVFTPDDLVLLRLMGERLVITHLDLIAYRNPVYHGTAGQWQAYRRATRLALGVADRVIFLSDHARRDAVAEELIEPGRTAIAGIGIERSAGDVQACRPDLVPADRALLVMIGSDYLHKNRPFALALLHELCGQGFDGVLVLAGGHVSHGSSAEIEAERLRADPGLAARVLDLGRVTEAEKRWLVSNAQALLCPSTYEGYGLTPLEAVAAGVPCAYAATTSLGELLGPQSAAILPWSAAASAERVLPLLTPGPERDQHLRSISAVLDRCRWGPIVDRLVDVYGEAIASPYRASNPRAWEELQREQYIVSLDATYRDLKARVAHGLRLIDRDGLLTQSQQRGLMRVATRPWLRGPVLAPFGALGELKTGPARDHRS